MGVLFNQINKEPIEDFSIKTELNGKIVEIDKECLNMVLFLNKIGYKTRMCCQGHYGNQGRNSFKIWFDKEVSDDKMLEFLEKVGQWENYALTQDDTKEGHVKLIKRKVGLTGWVYKRYYYFEDKLYTQWIYESSSSDVNQGIYIAREDFEKMKYTLGNADASHIFEDVKIRLEKKVERLNTHYDLTGESYFKK